MMMMILSLLMMIEEKLSFEIKEKKLMNAQAKVKSIFFFFPVLKIHNFFFQEEQKENNIYTHK